MNRKPTPDIMGQILEPPSETALIRAQLHYDYSLIDPEIRKTVQDAAVDIVKQGRKAQESLIVVGQRLIAVKDMLEHGQFSDWCQAEFQMTQRTVQNMMNVAKTFGDKSETVSLLSDSALYMLAAPSTPELARETVIQQAQATGKAPTKAEVKRVIDEHKPERQAQPPVSPEQRQYAASVLAMPDEGHVTAKEHFARYQSDLAAAIPAPDAPATTLPAELVARGWELRQLGTGRYYANNMRCSKATGVFDTADEAITAARSMQIDVPQAVNVQAAARPEPSAYKFSDDTEREVGGLLYALAGRWRASQVTIALTFVGDKPQYTVSIRSDMLPQGADRCQETRDTLEAVLESVLAQ